MSDQSETEGAVPVFEFEKGAVGKTTATAHLGTVPAPSPLVVDHDPQGPPAWNGEAATADPFTPIIIDTPPPLHLIPPDQTTRPDALGGGE